jgi:hypothetical protein
MFTGLVEGVGKITEVRRMAEGLRLAVTPPFPVAELALGESVAVSGACLTVVAIRDRAFQVDVSPETLARSTLSAKQVGDRVNLERALRLGDRWGGTWSPATWTAWVCSRNAGKARTIWNSPLSCPLPWPPWSSRKAPSPWTGSP